VDFISLVGILGTLASLAGVAVAIVQSSRMRELRRRTNADAWLSIRTVVAILRRLEESPFSEQDPQIASVYARVADLYRHLLKQAILDEKDFNEETINSWLATGKICSDWQLEQARNFLSK